MTEEWDELLKLNETPAKEDIKKIKKIIDKDKQRSDINARYYQKNKNKILTENAMDIKCKVCDVELKKGSYPYHKKSRLHQRLLKLRLDMIEEESDEE
jgi:hypothetical protein